MKNILIPTDFSTNAWNAIAYALRLYEHSLCTFYLLNTYTPNISSSRFLASSALEDGQAVETYSKEGLRALLKRVQKKYHNPLHCFKTISSFSLLVDEVKKVIDDYGIDMVIVGTKGASSLESVFMGSNAIRIIKAVKDCPVLAIPQDFEYTSPKEIALATGFNRFYILSELQPILNIVKTFNSVLRIIHVQDEIKALTELQQFNLYWLRKQFSTIEHHTQTVLELKSVSKTLQIFTEESEVHLLVMMNYQHSYLGGIIREPVVEKLTFQTQVPLLVIPELGMSQPLTDKKRNASGNICLEQ